MQALYKGYNSRKTNNGEMFARRLMKRGHYAMKMMLNQNAGKSRALKIEDGDEKPIKS